VRPSFALLAANYRYTHQRENLRRLMKPYAEFTRARLRIGVLGLTTDEIFYSWNAGGAMREAARADVAVDFPVFQGVNWIGTVLKKALETGTGYIIAGVTYEIETRNGKRRLKNLRVNDKPLNWLKSYRLALPEGVAAGGLDILPQLRMLWRKPRDTGVPIWTAIEDKLRREGEVRPPAARDRSVLAPGEADVEAASRRDWE